MKGERIDPKLLREARRERGMTQKDLITAMEKHGFKVSKGWIGNVETSRQNVRFDKLKVIALILRKSIDYFRETPPPDPVYTLKRLYELEEEHRKLAARVAVLEKENERLKALR